MQRPFSAYEGEDSYVFVCYAHDDQESVYPELEWLHQQGINVWYDEGIRPGHRWSDDLANALSKAARILFFASPRSAISENCLDELGFALDRGKPIYPVFLEPAKLPPGLQLRVGSRQFINKYELPITTFRTRLLEAASGERPAARSSQNSNASHKMAWNLGALVGIALTVTFLLLVGTGWLDPERSSEQRDHRRLTYSGEAVTPTISSDGEFVAYVEGDAVYVHDILNDQRIEAFEFEGLCGTLRWQPSAGHLALACRDGEVSRVHVIPRLGGNTRSFQVGGFVAWGPAAGEFSTAYQNAKVVTVTDIDTGSTRRINVDATGTWLNDLAWSPDGSYLVVLTMDSDLRSKIQLVRSDGTFANVLVSEQADLSSPRWSTDGRFVYYLQNAGEVTELWRVAVKSLEIEFLEPGLEAGPNFSIANDGTIAYTRSVGHSNIWLKEIGTEEPATQLTWGTWTDTDVSVSPDGKTVVFARWTGGAASNIYKMDVSGTEPQQLSYFVESINTSPVWSPDGTQIAFASNESGAPKVWLMNNDGSDLRVLEETSISTNMEIEWAPGSDILVQDPDVRNYRLVDPDTREQAPLITTAARGWTLNVIYDPDGERVAGFRNTGAYGIWVLNLTSPEHEALYVAGTDPLFARVSQLSDLEISSGTRIRLSARVRVEQPEDHLAMLWLRLDRADGTVAFLDDMTERPIKSTNWKVYSIETEIPPDASSVAFGGISKGFGKSWFDDFLLESRRNDGPWTPLNISNAGFEHDHVGDRPSVWHLDPPRGNYTIDFDDDTMNQVLQFDGTRDRERYSTEHLYPVGWDQAGMEVLAWDAASSSVVRVPIDLNKQEILQHTPITPFGSAKLAPGRMSQDGKLYVYEVQQMESDVWLRYIVPNSQ